LDKKLINNINFVFDDNYARKNLYYLLKNYLNKIKNKFVNASKALLKYKIN